MKASVQNVSGWRDSDSRNRRTWNWPLPSVKQRCPMHDLEVPLHVNTCIAIVRLTCRQRWLTEILRHETHHWTNYCTHTHTELHTQWLYWIGRKQETFRQVWMMALQTEKKTVKQNRGLQNIIEKRVLTWRKGELKYKDVERKLLGRKSVQAP